MGADLIFYWEPIQWFVSPSDYWVDPKNHEGYIKHSHFLAEANNEKNFDQARKDKWLGLKHARFVKWIDDEIIIPR